MQNRRAYAAFHSSLTALGSVLAFMAIPGYRIWALGSLANLVLACFLLTKWAQRKLLCGCFAVVAICSLGVEYFASPLGQINEDGMLVLALLFIAISCVSYGLYLAETDVA